MDFMRWDCALSFEFNKSYGEGVKWKANQKLYRAMHPIPLQSISARSEIEKDIPWSNCRINYQAMHSVDFLQVFLSYFYDGFLLIIEVYEISAWEKSKRNCDTNVDFIVQFFVSPFTDLYYVSFLSAAHVFELTWKHIYIWKMRQYAPVKSH